MLKQNKISERTITLDKSIIYALKRMDSTGFRSLVILDEQSLFCGILSIGDIQRAILRDVSLNNPIENILRSNPKVVTKETPFDQVKVLMMQYRMEFLPVVDDQKQLVDVYFWEEVFGVEQQLPVTHFNLPIVIMAGGMGSRLKPLTNVLPKPLIPIGEKTMLEEIFDRFGRYDCNRFFVSVNYKAELIEFYIRNQHLPYQVEFVKEEKPMGTAGSLSLLKGRITETFFVSNCDILIEQDYSEILDYHRANKNEITIVAALKTYPIAYGTVETGENGRLLKLVEKPELTFKINSGMYILEPQLLNEIPEDQFFHITHLIENVLVRNGKVGVFPVSEKSWKDIGEWDEYLNNKEG